ncbi:ThiF family adenylyltransferase (plasmid) [Lactococcus garvieae]|nr:ThiF family adenylyltransferase [Lactococcus garvieae]CEF52308.1 Molybdopterin-synthase adenylyltransferase [Lactococcus garvieae]
MKLKENVIIKYNNDLTSTIINVGTREFKIVDENQIYYKLLLNPKRIRRNSELFIFLSKNNLIVKDFHLDNVNIKTQKYFENQLISKVDNPGIGIETILNKKIIIIGCGGVGTVVIDNLIRAGFKCFTLIDHDIVEKSNLNRQLFYKQDDIGEKKVNALSTRLNEISNDIELQTSYNYVKETKNISMILDENSNIVINCADSPSNIESIIAKAAQEKEVPFISAFVGQETGTITQVYDSQNSYLHNIESEDILSLEASVSVTNMLVGSILAKKTIDYLLQKFIHSNYSFYSNQVINFETLRILHE